jgi:hypothetical protein
MREAHRVQRATPQDYALARWHLWGAIIDAIDAQREAKEVPGDKTVDLSTIIAEWLPADAGDRATNAKPEAPAGKPNATTPKILQVQPVAIAAEDDLRRRAIKARYNAALEETRSRFVAAQDFDGPKLGGAAPRLVTAQLALSDDPKAQVGVRERYWEWTTSYEREIEPGVAGEWVSRYFFPGVRYLRLGAEIDLLHARQKAGLPIHDLAAPAPQVDLHFPPDWEEVWGGLIEARTLALEPTDDPLRRLLKMRYNAALEGLLPSGDGPLARGFGTLEAASRVLESELALAANPGERIQARRKILQLAQLHERHSRAEYVEKRLPIELFARAQYQRYNAKIQLLEARRAAPQGKTP